MSDRRGRGSRVGAIALLLALLVTGVAAAAGSPNKVLDQSFGNHGRVAVTLPGSPTAARFGPVAQTANGGFLVVSEGERGGDLIQRREADGALDPSFGHGGSVAVAQRVKALAEDPAGGVVYVGGESVVKRLEPDGSPDEAFDTLARYSGPGEPATIAFDSQGRILIGGSNPEGPRAHPHEGEAELVRLESDGREDSTFGSKGLLYLGQGYAPEVEFLSDGSMLVLANGLQHVAVDGTVLSQPPVARPDQGSGLVVYPDGGFAFVVSLVGGDCGVDRYGPDDTIDPSFGEAGTFKVPGLSECRLSAAPEGGLLLSGVVKGADGTSRPQVLLLGASGTPASGFGNGSIALPASGEPADYYAPAIGGLAFTSRGLIVATHEAEEAILVGLAANGVPDPGFGSAGSIVESRSVPSHVSPEAITSEPDGELIVTGTSDAGGTKSQPFWMRFDATGNVIPAPSGAAFASVPVAASLVRPAGGEYVYGLVEKEEGPTSIAKFELDGALVAGFGSGGLAALPRRLESTSFVVDPDGGVTAVGHIGATRMAAYRLTAEGRPEAGFGHRGLATARFPGAAETQAATGALMPGGDLVLAGLEDSRLAVAELGPDGRLRRGFGHGGFLTCACGGPRPDEVKVVPHRGHIYLLDYWSSSAAGDGGSLVKVSATGRLERSFARRGYRAVRIGTPLALFAHGGRLMVVGEKAVASGPAQVREYDLDGAAARAYDAGSTLFGGPRPKVRLLAAAQPSGRIVIADELRAKREIEGSQLELLGLR